jgi:hypothetical protein
MVEYIDRGPQVSSHAHCTTRLASRAAACAEQMPGAQGALTGLFVPDAKGKQLWAHPLLCGTATTPFALQWAQVQPSRLQKELTALGSFDDTAVQL